MYRDITRIGFLRLQDALNLRLGSHLTSVFISFISKISIYTPFFLMRFTPKSLACLFASYMYHSKGDEKRIFAWADRALKSKFIGHQKAALYIKLNYIFIFKSSYDFDRFIENNVKSSNYLFDFYTTWSFHNNSQFNHAKLLKDIMNRLSATALYSKPTDYRYLPQHTTNMGHLGNLFLYANYYRHVDKNRKIVLWPEISPNKYYLEQLLKLLPFSVRLLTGLPNQNFLNPQLVDTLEYSAISPSNWRLESAVCSPTTQLFPEYLISEEFCLKGDDNFTEFAISKLCEIGFDKNKWFVILHVKENIFGFRHGGETRDADIETYNLACELIRELGGQVVRMGNQTFPKLSRNFQAIDYAHCKIRSEKMDFWLWANCRFWIGTANGAWMAVLPFNKPRIATNQWPLNIFGSPNDFIVPKMILEKSTNRILYPQEIISMKFSRTMKRDFITRSGFELLENPPELLRDTVLEMVNRLETKKDHSRQDKSIFESELISSFKQTKDGIYSKIPKIYDFYLNGSK